MKLKTIAPLVVFVFLAGCSSTAAETPLAFQPASGPPTAAITAEPTQSPAPTVTASPEQKDELARNQQKWLEAAIRQYQYKLSISCFCGFSQLMPLTIEVANGEVRSITAVDGAPVTPDDVNYKYFVPFATVEGLFATIESNLGRAEEVTVSYDEMYGFPANIFIDQFKLASDDELGLQVTGFQIQQGVTSPSPALLPDTGK